MKKRVALLLIATLTLSNAGSLVAGELIPEEVPVQEEISAENILVEEELPGEIAIEEAVPEEEIEEEAIPAEETAIPVEAAEEIIPEEELPVGELIEEPMDDSFIPEDTFEEEMAIEAIEPITEEVPAEEIDAVPSEEEGILEEEEPAFVGESSGYCGNDVQWNLGDDGILTISGTGDMWDWSDYNDLTPWYEVKQQINSIIIESGVTSIGDYAFSNCGSLEAVTIKDGVTSVGDYAFYNCYSLGAITFEGDAPAFGTSLFEFVNATAYYPAGNSTWTPEVRQNYGGNITWKTFGLVPGKITASDIVKSASDKIQTFSIGATRLGTGKLSYSTTSTKVMVDSNGIVVIPPNFVGEATITIEAAASGAYDKATKKITVTVNKTEGKLSAEDITFNANATKSQSKTIVVKDQLGNGKLTYKSSNSRVTVDSTGKVTVPQNYSGTSTITIKAEASGIYEEATTSIKVTVKRIDGKITADDITLSANPDKAQIKTIFLKSQLGKGALTYSSNNSYVTVDSEGKVTVSKNYAGTATITIDAAASGIYKAASTKIKIIVNKIDGKITATDFIKNAYPEVKSFYIGARCLGGGKLTYKSNSGKVTVDSNGKVTIPRNYAGIVTIRIYADTAGIYKSAFKKITVTVRPQIPTIASLANSGTKKFTAKWDRYWSATGYVLQYATNDKFTAGVRKVLIDDNGIRTKDIYGLSKGKTYYVRLRTYRKIGNTTLYSGWSPIKSVKIYK